MVLKTLANDYFLKVGRGFDKKRDFSVKFPYINSKIINVGWTPFQNADLMP